MQVGVSSEIFRERFEEMRQLENLVDNQAYYVWFKMEFIDKFFLNKRPITW